MHELIVYGFVGLVATAATVASALHARVRMLEENFRKLHMACDFETRDRFNRIVVNRKDKSMTLNWRRES